MLAGWADFLLATDTDIQEELAYGYARTGAQTGGFEAHLCLVWCMVWIQTYYYNNNNLKLSV